MGKKQSKVLQTTGDPQVQILNQLEVNTDQHNDQENKLSIILILVAINLALSLYKIYKEHSRRQALKAAKTAADLREI